MFYRIFLFGVTLLGICYVLGSAAYGFTTHHSLPLLPFLVGFILLWGTTIGFGALGLFLVVTGFLDLIDLSPKPTIQST